MINNKRILSVITARGGSKGVPLKNVKPLLDKPLFLWSVLASLESNYIDMTVVSSNCPEVYKKFHEFNEEINYKYSDNNKLKFIQRPEELSTDTSINEEALIHSVYWIRDIFKLEFDVVINLQPTSPCRLSGLLDHCIEEHDRNGYDSLFTASKHTPFFWQKKDGKWHYLGEDCCKRKMRQEISEEEFVFHDNGNIYIVNSKILLDKKCRIGYNHGIVETTGVNSLQIDTEFDFKLIGNMAKVMGIESLV